MSEEKELKIILKNGELLKVDEMDHDKEWVYISPLSRYFKRQSQYLSRFFYRTGDKNTPYFGEGIRSKNENDSYHEWQFHKDDVPEIVERIEKYYQTIPK